MGGGASTLVDDLVGRGYREVTVLDLSKEALDVARARLGTRAAGVSWVAADATTVELPEAHYDVWHDRAVFHFLVDPDARRRYVASVTRSVRPGGHVIVATFGPERPERCSGLDVVRYDAEALHGEFGARFLKIDSVHAALADYAPVTWPPVRTLRTWHDARDVHETVRLITPPSCSSAQTA